jgi:hypothetical protein
MRRPTQKPRRRGRGPCGSIRDKKNDGESIPMRPYDHDAGDTDALPTDGMDVEEVRDPDTLRRFVLEWHRCDCYARTETVVLRPPHVGGKRLV